MGVPVHYRFPKTKQYLGVDKEQGYNGLYFFGVSHSWVRNVELENADIGIVFDTSSHNSVINVTFSSSCSSTPTGGKGIWIKVGTGQNTQVDIKPLVHQN
jgi:hypothetical protein